MAQDYELHPGLLQADNDDVSTSWYRYKLRKNIRIYQAGWCQFICCLLLTSTVITFVEKAMVYTEKAPAYESCLLQDVLSPVMHN